MYTLTYESQAIKGLGSDEMDEILRDARAFNSANGITGCLIYNSGTFIQILEGRKKIVLQLYEKIKDDNRHTDTRIFSEDKISERTFPGWGMAYFPIEENLVTATEFEQFKRNIILLADLSKPTNVTAIIFWKRIKYLLSLPPEKL